MEGVIHEWWSELQRERKCYSTSKTAKIVNKSPPEVQDNVRVLISNLIKQDISESIQSQDISKKFNLCNAINGCFDNFTQAMDGVNISFSEIIHFIDLCIDDCRDKLLVRDCAQCNMVKMLDFLHSLNRILVLVLKLRRPLKSEQKCFHLPELISNDKEVLSKLSYKMSSFFRLKEIVMDTKCTMAMASLLTREILLKEKEKLVQFHNDFLACLPSEINDKDYELNVLKFLLANAMLNTWSNTVVDANSTGTYLKFFIQLCESYSSDTGIILNICRTLILLIKNETFNEFMTNLNSENFYLVNSLLSCVYMLVDHPVPCVRHSSKDFLRLLAGYEKFRSSMLKSLPSLLVEKRSYFMCLPALAKKIGSRSLFDADRSLPNNLFMALNDPVLVTYVVNALECIVLRDSLAYEDFSLWCERWIVPLLVSLRKVPCSVSADIEKLLQNLFSQYPSAIFYITDKWLKPKNDEELHYIMAALKIYRKHGFMEQNYGVIQVNIKAESEFQEKKWKDLISEKLLRFCLHHNDDDIRLSAFSLIVDGLKTTEKYTEQDFDLVQYSLKCNLNNQQPATRQKFLSLIKKMLMRYADSLVVLKRNLKSTLHGEYTNVDLTNYSKFKDWLINFCFSNIFDGANFNRLNTILSLFLIFLKLEDVTVDYSVAEYYLWKILVPLRSTYEENKIMAVTLVKKLNVLKFYNDTESVTLLFKKAYELSGRMEPPNVLTGAYLLQTLLEYPFVEEIIEEYLSENTDSLSPELMFIVLLSKKLEEQICGAETNLLRAAMNGPMYGTLFAIRIILREMDFSNLDENKENDACAHLKQTWSLVLKNLIELGFRMIHVVSCVVNSSSPEGHLPSDFQSDLQFMMMEDESPREVGDIENRDQGVEETLNDLYSVVQNMNLDDSNRTRTSQEIIYKCDRFVRHFNRTFLKHGDSRSFSRQNATEFKDLLRVCTRLMSEMKKIHANKISDGCESNKESEYLTCLASMETELRNCIAIYEKNNCRNGGPTAQALLLCSWRTIKEVCLFLGDLVSKLPLKKMIKWELLTEEMLVAIGVELRTLLCEIKHRGAFEHAYLGFSQLITAFWKCPRKSLNDLPQKWLQEILSEIKQPVENQTMKFCSSRRSAGLPFLVQAIIASELQCTNSAKIQSLDTTMNSLLAVAEAEEDLVTVESKIHSLNILRALFKHAMFGEHVAPYVSRGLMVAVRGSRATAWSIRNSSSLLFSSLVIRIFGVARNKDVLSNKNRMTGRHFFQRYPELYEFFLNEMKLAFQGNVKNHVYHPQPHVFHILLILGRLYPSPTEDPMGIDFSEFLPFINTSCRNATLKIRELGARALVPLICLDTFIEELDLRFSLLESDDNDNNYRHGILLQVKTMLLEMWEKTKLVRDSIDERGKNWIRDTESILDVGEKRVPYLIKIAYVQILHVLFKVGHSLREQINEMLNRRELLESTKNSNEIEGKIPGRFAYLETFYFVKFDIAAHMWLEHHNNDDLTASIMSMLTSEVDEVQTIALVLLQYITSERYEDSAGEEDANLITVRLRDLFSIEDENRFNALKVAVMMQSPIREYVMQSFFSLLNNAKNSNYLYKIITKLQISVISNYMLNNLIFARDIYESRENALGISRSVLDSLSDILDCESSEISVGAFICYSVFFFENLKYDFGDLTPGSVSYFTKLLFSFSAPEADVKQRKAVCEIFNKYYHCFNCNLFKEDNQAMSIWMLPLKLMSDEDPSVRRRAMELVSKYQKLFSTNNESVKLNGEFDDVYLSELTGIPSKAQETLLECYIRCLDANDLFNLVVQMVAFTVSAYINTINYEHISKQNEDGIFDKGNPNPFCEELTFGKLLCGKLEELKTSVDIKSLFKKKLEATHVAALKERFPSLIFPHFPETLKDFCIQILNTLIEIDPEKHVKTMSCLQRSFLQSNGRLMRNNLSEGEEWKLGILNIKTMRICNRYPKELLHYDNRLKRKCFRKLQDNVWENKTKWQLLVKAEWTYHYKQLSSCFRSLVTYTNRKIARKNKIRDAEDHYSRKMKCKVFSVFKRNREKEWLLVREMRHSVDLKIMRKTWNRWEKYVRKNLRAKEVAALTIKTRELLLIKSHIGLWLINYNQKIRDQKLYANAESHNNQRVQLRTIKKWKDYVLHRRRKKELASYYLKNFQLNLKRKAFSTLTEYSSQKKLYRQHIQIIASFYENYILKNVLDIWSNRYENLIEFRNMDKNSLATQIYDRKLIAKCFKKLKIWIDKERLRISAAEKFLSIAVTIKIQFYLEVWRKSLYDRLLCQSMEIKAVTWRNFQLTKICISTFVTLLEKKKEEGKRIEDFISYCNFKILSKTFQMWSYFLHCKRVKTRKNDEARRYYESGIVQKSFEKLKRYAAYKIRKNSVVSYYEGRLLSKAFRSLKNFSETKRFHRNQIASFRDRSRRQILQRSFSIFKYIHKIATAKMRNACNVSANKTKKRVLREWKKHCESKSEMKNIWNTNRLILQEIIVREMILTWWKNAQSRLRFRGDLKTVQMNQEKRLVGRFFRKWLNIRDKFTLLRRNALIFSNLKSQMILHSYVIKLVSLWEERRNEKKKKVLADFFEKGILLRRFFKQWVAYVNWKMEKLKECSTKVGFSVSEAVANHRNYYFCTPKSKRKQPMIPAYLREEFALSITEDTFSS